MSFGMSQTGGSNAPMIKLLNQGLQWMEGPYGEGKQAWQNYENKAEASYKKGEEYLKWGLENLFGATGHQEGLVALAQAAQKYGSEGIPAVGFNAGPGGSTWGVDAQGNVTYNRGTEAQDYMTKLLTGFGADVGELNTLLGKVAPETGELGNRWIEQLRGEKSKALSDLRAQQAARRTLGSSFAQQQYGSLEADYAQKIGLARAEATVKEMEMSSQVIAQRTQTVLSYIGSALSQIQFEGGIGVQLMSNAQQAALHMRDLEADMTKAYATMVYNNDAGRASLLTGIGVPVMNLINTVATTAYGGLANLAQAKMETGAGLYSSTISAVGQNEASQGSSFSMGLSDRRLKQDIEQVGELFDGQPVYRFRFIGDPELRLGLMADEVEKVHPEAVATVHGYQMVDYEKATNDSVRGT